MTCHGLKRLGRLCSGACTAEGRDLRRGLRPLGMPRAAAYCRRVGRGRCLLLPPPVAGALVLVPAPLPMLALGPTMAGLAG